jgi:hypothetical protein
LQLLSRGGLTPSNVELVPRLTPLDTDFQGWMQTFARNTWFSGLSDEDASDLMVATEAVVEPDCRWSDDSAGGYLPESGSGTVKSGWELMYVRLRGTATVSEVQLDGGENQ